MTGTTEQGLDRYLDGRATRARNFATLIVKEARQQAYRMVQEAQEEIARDRAEAEQQLLAIMAERKAAKSSAANTKTRAAMLEATMEERARAKAEKLLDSAKSRADRIIANAKAKSLEMRRTAREECRAKLRDAGNAIRNEDVKWMLNEAQIVLGEARAEFVKAEREAKIIREVARTQALASADVEIERKALELAKKMVAEMNHHTLKVAS